MKKIFGWIKAIFTGIGILFCGMFGGQKEKNVRRYGIPSIAVLSGWETWRWRTFAYFLFIPTLCMGYGENSWLMGIIGNDTIVRITYAILLSAPFFVFGLIRATIANVALIMAFLIRGGSAGNVFGMDILIEDVFRYGTLGILVVLNNIIKKRE